MLAPTHSIFGIFLSLTVLAIFGVKEGLHWSIIVITIFGSLLPDIDLPRSTLGRIFPFISKPLERKFGHRSITHSLVGWLIASVSFSLLILGVGYILRIFEIQSWTYTNFQYRWLAAFAIGYISHLLLDMLNPRGSQMFWPNTGRDVLPKNVQFRPEVGTKSELIVFLIILILMFASFPLSRYGITSSLRWLLATPESVIQEYKNLDTKLYIEFQGIYKTTRTQVTGTAELLDVENKRLIVLYENRVFTLSDELTADIIAKKVRFQKTDIPIKIEQKQFETQTREYLTDAIPTASLVSGIVHLPQGLEIDFTKLNHQEARSAFKTLEQKKSQLILNFATKHQIQLLDLDELYRIQMKKDASAEKQLQIKTAILKAKIKSLKSAHDGYTAYGRAMHADPHDEEHRLLEIKRLEQELISTELGRKELALKMNSRKFVFSGDVIIRY